MQDNYRTIKEYNIREKRKILIIFNDMLLISLILKKTKSSSNRIVY